MGVNQVDAKTNTELRANALGLPQVVMQAVTHIGPAVGTVLSLQFIAFEAGVKAPIAFFVTWIIVLLLGGALTQLAQEFPSAGGYYTYVSRTVHPRAGWFTAWLYFLYDPVATAINLAFLGFYFQAIMLTTFGITFEWWWLFLIGLVVVTIPIYRGVRISSQIMLFLGLAEITIIVALAVTGLVHPGHGGLNVQAFTLSNVNGHGLFLGIVFCIFLFTGFESVAPLAEESRNPRALLPRAIMISIIGIGVFFLLSSWGIMVGYGTGNVAKFGTTAANPVVAFAKSVWGWGWLLVLFAIFNTIFAVSIACTNAATRVFYGMGRTGALPKWFAGIHPVYKTPRNAIIFQTAVTLFAGLVMGFTLGPANEFYMMGEAITFGLGLVYIAGNIGVVRYFVGEGRPRFNFWLHIVLPIVPSIALVIVFYESLVPYPAFPSNIAPILVLVWIILGIGITYWLSRTGREEWMKKAGEVYDSPGTTLEE